jgi:hypothetical protein
MATNYRTSNAFGGYHSAFGNFKIKAPKKKGGISSFAVPSGLYDPSLDYQQQAASRGVQDLSADTTLGNARLSDDYNLGLGQNTEDAQYGQKQLDTSHTRTLADIAQARGRSNEDYGNATAALTRRYGILGGQQGEAANAAGVGEGGALIQAQQKRTANQAIDQAPIDLGHNRTLADLATQEGRTNEDYATQTARESQLSSRAAGGLGLTYERGTQDANTGLARAKRENSFYKQGIQQQRIFQATQAGWHPPAPPKKKKGKR